MPICVAVRKKIVGFISGDERINAITALNGTPDVMSDNPTGIAAYVGIGEMIPMTAAESIAKYSFREEKCIFFPRKYLMTNTLRTILMSRNGLILKKRSKKSSRILSVYVPSNQ
jgi:hypothetical protein